jgi:hypothetical protein
MIARAARSGLSRAVPQHKLTKVSSVGTLAFQADAYIEVQLAYRANVAARRFFVVSQMMSAILNRVLVRQMSAL